MIWAKNLRSWFRATQEAIDDEVGRDLHDAAVAIADEAVRDFPDTARAPIRVVATAGSPIREIGAL